MNEIEVRYCASMDECRAIQQDVFEACAKIVEEFALEYDPTMEGYYAAMHAAGRIRAARLNHATA